MRKSLFTLSLLLISMASFADVSIDWIRTSENSLTGTAVARDAQDNVYSATSTGGILFEKRDRFGNFLWQATSSTTIPFNYEYPSWVHIDPQNNPVLIGFRYTSPSEGKPANSLIVLKYDQNGNLIYKKNIDGNFSYFSNSQMSTYYTKITSQMDAAGNVYIGTAGGVNGYPTAGFTVVKVSPAGNVVWVSSKAFTSATNFHFVLNIRLKGNRLALAGVTNYPTANSTHWVLDTTGTDLWSNIQEGVQGKDAAFDNKGNVYFLTWVSVNFSGDVKIYKFNSAGTLLWGKKYDFGGSDLASRMEFTSDKGIVVMAYGNSSPGGSLYVDWITFKIKMNGSLVWSKRYDKTSSNDEYPNMMTLDTDGDIFITGIGGPFPGGSNLGARQMVTLKYSKAGVEEWSAVIDTITEYLEGVGIAVATDGSIYVLGSANSILIHYLDHSGVDPCNVPTGVAATAITNETATISWTPIANDELYHIQYKPTTSLTWLQISTDATSFTLTSLTEGTTYEYRVEAVCNSGPTGYSATQQFTTTGTGYCASKGLDATKEWIDLVYVGTLLNSTPTSDGGYADYTNLSVDLVQGGTYDITLSADMNPYGSTEVWRVWIDYNQDNDFLDAGEKEVGYKSEQIGWETHTFSVPLTAAPGLTRMRVSMKHGTAPSPCEVFALGEVEDYTVNILPAKSDPQVPGTSQLQAVSLALSPNPGSAFSMLSMEGMSGKVTIEIFDVTGKLIHTQIADADKSVQLDMNDWRSGLYLVRATDSNALSTTTKLSKQ